VTSPRIPNIAQSERRAFLRSVARPQATTVCRCGGRRSPTSLSLMSSMHNRSRRRSDEDSRVAASHFSARRCSRS